MVIFKMKEYKDEILNCIKCKNEFVFTVEKQKLYDRIGFTNKPVRCRPCIRKKVLEKRITRKKY